MTAATKTVRCCVKCDECSDCYTHTLYELRDLMLAIDVSVSGFVKSYTQRINWGYACISISEEAAKMLLSYKSTIRRHYDSIRQGSMACLCDAEFQRVKEAVLRIVDLARCKTEKVVNIWYDYLAYNNWVTANPNCVAYDSWAKGMVIKCNPTFAISVTKDESILRTLYAIATKDKENCVIKLLAYAYKARCENKVSISASVQAKCKTELKALVKKHGCDMSLSLYVRLLQCNLSFNLISTILGCGGKFLVDGDGNPKVKIGAKVAKIDEVIKLAGGTWADLDGSEYENLYG